MANRSLIRAKKGSEITLNGVTVCTTIVDGSFKSVTFTDDVGRSVTVTGDYGLSVLLPAPPTMVKRFVLRGQVLGLKVDEQFEDRYAAESRKGELVGAGYDELTITEEEIEDAA